MRMKSEVLIIGAGPGGYVAAIRAAQLGKEVTLVEKEERLGGVCLNFGCIPSKALISTVGLAHKIKHMSEMGLEADIKLDYPKLQSWKDCVVKRLADGIEKLCKGNGINVIRGQAVFTGENTANVQTEKGARAIEFKHAIIATGSKPLELAGFKFDGEGVLDSTDALALTEVPESLLIIGGGYIGLELGTVYAKLGSKVTVVEMMDQLLPGTDPELARVVARKLSSLGVEVHLKAKAQALKSEGDKINLIVEKNGEEISFTADKIIMAVGRQPNTAGLLLEKAQVKLDNKGFIIVDKKLRTTNPNIYAIGDAIGGPMLAHKASKEGIIAAEVIAGLPRAKDFKAVPAVIFTDPEIATVGLTEKEAQLQGFKVIVGRFPFAALGRALTAAQTEGFVKLVADEESKRILGVHIVGPEASNLISEAALAIEMGATLEDLALTVHPHPTLPEALMEAAEVALGQPIHILKKGI